MTTRRRVRRGVTLIEVLVAIFVMGIGMLALLTLFPLGALQMGEAVRHDRCAQTAQQADALMRQYWRVQYLEAIAPPPGVAPRQPTDDTLWALDDPNLLWRGHHLPGPIQDMFVDQYVSPQSFPAGRLLPGGINLAPGVLTGSPFPYAPMPPPLPALTPVRFFTPPADGFASPPYAQPALPLDYRYSQVGRRPGPISLGSPVQVSVPSYAVLIDPLGFTNRSGMSQVWVAGFPGPIGQPDSELVPAPVGSPFPFPLRLARRTMGFNPGRLAVHGQQLAASTPYLMQYFPGSGTWPIIPPAVLPDPMLYNASQAFRTCALTDDLNYEPNGGPPGGGVVSRQGKYSWMALVQRPRHEDPTTLSLSILVFDNRQTSLAIPGEEMMTYADPWPVTMKPLPQPLLNDRQLLLSLPARTPEQAPLLRRGGWILDATISMNPTIPAGGTRNSQFYRVTGVTELGPSPTISGGVQYVIDIDPPFRDAAAPVAPSPTPGGLPVPQTQYYLFAGLAEVFDRQPLKPDTKYQP